MMSTTGGGWYRAACYWLWRRLQRVVASLFFIMNEGAPIYERVDCVVGLMIDDEFNLKFDLHCSKTMDA